MKRVAVIVAGTLGAAAFAFPSIGFARTHSARGLAAECSALSREVTILQAKLAGPPTPSADAAAIYSALIAKTQAKETALGCP